MLRKLPVFWLALVALLVLGMVAPVAAQDTSIRYFTFSAAPDHLKDLDTIIAGFEKENPGIKITVETAAFADYFTLLQSGVASGDAPDVFELNYENFVTYAANGTLLDLSGKVNADAPFYPRALEAFS